MAIAFKSFKTAVEANKELMVDGKLFAALANANQAVLPVDYADKDVIGYANAENTEFSRAYLYLALANRIRANRAMNKAAIVSALNAIDCGRAPKNDTTPASVMKALNRITPDYVSANIIGYEKAVDTVNALLAAGTQVEQQPVKRSRKRKAIDIEVVSAEEIAAQKAKRGRGRPRKVSADEFDAVLA